MEGEGRIIKNRMICEPIPLQIDIEALGLTKDQILILSIAGSHMYGTSTPDSDEDYVGVYIPSKKQILLNQYPNQIPVPKESGLDCKIWSIHYFIDNICRGETMAIDLLHSPYDCWLLYNTQVWPWLVENKHKFYTKNMEAYTSYAMKQASKYGNKGSNIKTLKSVISFLENKEGFTVSLNINNKKLKDIWDDLPTGEHIHFIDPIDSNPYRMYQVCGAKFHETVKISYILNALKMKLTSYGNRAIIAEQNGGIDWKAISHAIRAAEQLYWILRYGSYSYPLKNADFITQVKMGKISLEMAYAVFEDYMNEIKIMTEKCNLPDNVDKKIWMDWLMKFLEGNLL